MSLSRKKQKREQARIEREQEQKQEQQKIQQSQRKYFNIEPKTPNQAEYLKTIETNNIVFCTGPAGTGKTFLAIFVACKKLMEGQVDKIILCRPAVEAGERFGFLPGDLKEKIDPYLQPAYDALYSFLGIQKTEKFIHDKVIEIAPLAFMRGRTFNNAFVILDEAQNATRAQMKMFLTRMGHDSKVVVNGDMTQTDLRPSDSGLLHAIKILVDIKDIAHRVMSKEDIVRNQLVQKIVEAYEKDNQ